MVCLYQYFSTLIEHIDGILQILQKFFEILMHTRELFQNSNPRTRSFLSPSHKFGCRSFSISDHHSTINTDTSASWKKIKHQPNSYATQYCDTKQKKIKLNEYNRKGENLTIHKNSKNKPQYPKEHKQKENERLDIPDNSDARQLHVLIRQMRQKIRLLEKQNAILKEQQYEDVSLVRKQNQVIYQFQSIIKELSHKNDRLKKMVGSLKEDIPELRTELTCEQCQNQKQIENYQQGIMRGVLKLKEERDFLKRQNQQLEGKLESVVQSNYIYQSKIQQLANRYHVTKQILQISSRQHQQISEIQALLKGI